MSDGGGNPYAQRQGWQTKANDAWALAVTACLAGDDVAQAKHTAEAKKWEDQITQNVRYTDL